MRRYGAVLLAMLFASGCGVTTKSFKVFTEPSDAAIKVVSGKELKEQRYTAPARITADVPTDPALAKRAVLEVTKDKYKPKTIALSSIKDGDIVTVKLEKMAAEAVRYKLSCRMVGPVVSQELQFRDKAIAVSFSVEDQSFQMRFENLGPREVKILWEQAMYTDVFNQQHRLMHSGIRFQDRNSLLPAQAVPSHASVQEALIPVSNVSPSQKGGYEVRPLFQFRGDAAAGLKGRTINLFIPVELDRVIAPYTFKIEILDAVKEPLQ